MRKLSPYALGATLYMPATRTDILDVILHGKVEGLRSLVICLEDAVSESDVPDAIASLNTVANALACPKGVSISPTRPIVFVRPRNVAMAEQLVSDMDLSGIDGFVLPKFTLGCLPAWYSVLSKTTLHWMPTLETSAVFDMVAMQALACELEGHPCRDKILALRIGGNDLMNTLALRRSRTSTLYDGPMGFAIKMLTCTFASRGFSLTSPVCELIGDNSILQRELALDLEHGLVGKTAIHPSQVGLINAAFRVSSKDHADAIRIINTSQAVFQSNGAMCEPATHRRWANGILDRTQYHGLDQGG